MAMREEGHCSVLCVLYPPALENNTSILTTLAARPLDRVLLVDGWKEEGECHSVFCVLFPAALENNTSILTTLAAGPLDRVLLVDGWKEEGEIIQYPVQGPCCQQGPWTGCCWLMAEKKRGRSFSILCAIPSSPREQYKYSYNAGSRALGQGAAGWWLKRRGRDHSVFCVLYPCRPLRIT